MSVCTTSVQLSAISERSVHIHVSVDACVYKYSCSTIFPRLAANSVAASLSVAVIASQRMNCKRLRPATRKRHHLSQFSNKVPAVFPGILREAETFPSFLQEAEHPQHAPRYPKVSSILVFNWFRHHIRTHTWLQNRRILDYKSGPPYVVLITQPIQHKTIASRTHVVARGCRVWASSRRSEASLQV